MRDAPFKIRALVVVKERIYSPYLRTNGTAFFNYSCRQLLTNTFGSVQDAKVFIDGNSSRRSLQELATYLRKNCWSGDQKVVRKVKTVPKKENNVLVQLADMSVGTIARSYNPDKRDRHECYNLLRPRIDDIWEFGEE